MSLQENASFPNGLNDEQLKTLSIVYVSSLSLSLLGSISVLVVSIIKHRHLNEQAWPLIQLALADLLASAMLLFTTVENFDQCSSVTKFRICKFGIPLAMAFYCISFLLVMVYACRSKRAVQGWRERREGGHEQSAARQNWKLWVVYAAVWSVPIAIYFLYVFTERVKLATIDTLQTSEDTATYQAMGNDYATFCTSCILLLRIRNDSCPHVDKVHVVFVKTFFLVSGFSVLISCIVMYNQVGRWYRRYRERGLVEGDGFDRRNLRGVYSTARNMVLVIIICWTPMLGLVSLSFTDIPQRNLFPLYVIQALTVSIQGLLNSGAYGWLRQNFREAALGERMPLLANLPKTFYDESLAT